jgi:glycosyltransferase involved in cell wall biosynthesis
MAGSPLVSIVMPTYRRAGQIAPTLASITGQSLGDFELLVRDDGDGADGTEQAARAATAGDARVRYHRNARRLGMPGNLNAGIREARGVFIAVCHDHDLYRADFLEKMVATLQRHPSALFVHCAIDMIGVDGHHVTSHVGAWPELTEGGRWLDLMLRSFSSPVCALTVVPRAVHDRHGLYDPAYGFVSDVEMWMRLASVGDVAYVAEPLVRVREREPGHWATANALRLSRTTAAIQRRYLRRAYHGLAVPFRRLILEARLGHTIARELGARVVRSLA